MNCPNCGTPNLDENDFCTQCGQNMRSSIFCPKCGKKNLVDNSFCAKCGSALLPKGPVTIDKKEQTGEHETGKEEQRNQPQVPNQTIIIQQDQKKRSNWIPWLLVFLLALSLACIALIWLDVVDVPENILNRLPEPIQMMIQRINNPENDNLSNGDEVVLEEEIQNNVFDNESLCELFSSKPVSLTKPRFENENVVKGQVVFAWPEQLLYLREDVADIVVQHRDDPDKTEYDLDIYIDASKDGVYIPTSNGQCKINHQNVPITISCSLEIDPGDLPIEGRWTYKLFLEISTHHPLPQEQLCENTLPIDMTVVIKPQVADQDPCFFKDIDSFEGVKMSYWFSSNLKDLYIKTTKNTSFLFEYPSYTVSLSKVGATSIERQCAVLESDPTRLDCLFSNFIGPSGNWTIAIAMDDCPLYEDTLSISIPVPSKCPSGETWYEGWPYNNGCCTDGCWCVQNGELGCWTTCASHCNN